MSAPEVFQIAPTALRLGWVYGIFALAIVVFAGVLGGVAWSVVGAAGARYQVVEGALVVRGGFYGRTIPLNEIDASGVRAVNLDHESELRPVRRRNGTSLPGLRSGWFTLGNGRKALVFLTDGRRVVYAPGLGDFDLLLSAVDPDAMVRALREVGGAI